jgi:hypothetical protein
MSVGDDAADGPDIDTAMMTWPVSPEQVGRAAKADARIGADRVPCCRSAKAGAPQP